MPQQNLSPALLRQMEYSRQVRELLAARYDHPPMAYVHSFGCQQNQSDGEKIAGMLAQMGYGFTDAPEQADLVIYNTCAVRENAEDRVFGNVGALKSAKKRRAGMLIGLCGCMMQQQAVADKIKKAIRMSIWCSVRTPCIRCRACFTGAFWEKTASFPPKMRAGRLSRAFRCAAPGQLKQICR